MVTVWARRLPKHLLSVSLVQPIAQRELIAELGDEVLARPGDACRRPDGKVAIVDGRHALQENRHDDVGIGKAPKQVRRALGERGAKRLESRAHFREVRGCFVQAKVVLAGKPRGGVWRDWSASRAA